MSTILCVGRWSRNGQLAWFTWTVSDDGRSQVSHIFGGGGGLDVEGCFYFGTCEIWKFPGLVVIAESRGGRKFGYERNIRDCYRVAQLSRGVFLRSRARVYEHDRGRLSARYFAAQPGNKREPPKIVYACMYTCIAYFRSTFGKYYIRMFIRSWA